MPDTEPLPPFISAGRQLAGPQSPLPVRRRVARVLSRLLSSVGQLDLTNAESNFLADFAIWEAVVLELNDVVLDAAKCFEFLSWLLCRHLDHVHATRRDELASNTQLHLLRDSAHSIFSQLVIIDLQNTEKLHWRFKSIKSIFSYLRSSNKELEAHDYKRAKEAIHLYFHLDNAAIDGSSVELYGSPTRDISPRLLVPSRSTTPKNPSQTKTSKDSFPDAQPPNQNSNLSSIISSESRSTTELLPPNGAHTATRSNTRLEIAATQSSDATVSPTAQHNSQSRLDQVHSSPIKSTQPSSALGRVLSGNVPQLASFVELLIKDDVESQALFEDALKEAHDFVKTLKEHSQAMKTVEQSSEDLMEFRETSEKWGGAKGVDDMIKKVSSSLSEIESLKKELYKVLDVYSNVVPGIESRIDQFRSDFKLIFTYQDKRLDKVDTRLVKAEEDLTILNALDQRQAHLHDAILKMKAYIDSKLDKRLAKLQGVLNKFNSDLQIIAERTIKMATDLSSLEKKQKTTHASKSTDVSAVLKKRVENAIQLAQKSKRDVTEFRDEFDLEAVKRRVTKLEKRNDVEGFEMYSKLEDIEKLSAQLVEYKEREVQSRRRIDDLELENATLSEEMNEMKTSFKSLENMVNQLRSSQSIRSNSSQDMGPIAESTQQTQTSSPTVHIVAPVLKQRVQKRHLASPTKMTGHPETHNTNPPTEPSARTLQKRKHAEILESSKKIRELMHSNKKTVDNDNVNDGNASSNGAKRRSILDGFDLDPKKLKLLSNTKKQ